MARGHQPGSSLKARDYEPGFPISICDPIALPPVSIALLLTPKNGFVSRQKIATALLTPLPQLGPTNFKTSRMLGPGQRPFQSH